MKGEIEVESKKGEGTTFKIELLRSSKTEKLTG